VRLVACFSKTFFDILWLFLDGFYFTGLGV